MEKRIPSFLSAETYVYIDASNIRNALKSCGVELSFERLLEYLKKKYERLIEVKYFEGAEIIDSTKISSFNALEELGYRMYILDRKVYTRPDRFKSVKCVKCGATHKVRILKASQKQKSNVDVFLCSEVMNDVLLSRVKRHIILITCDGDYAEMIKKAISVNKNIIVSVISTPYRKRNNYLSSRLRKLESINRFHLINILSIKGRISKK